jgi:DNA-directed RNA polymerase specialized sigma24 family protein
MTEQETLRHRNWLMHKYGDIDGEDIFQQACLIAIKRYQTIEKTNQNLFGLISREAARELLAHRKHEIPFSCLRQENSDQTDEMEFDPMDPAWEKDFVAIEEREEIQKIHGQWLLNALLKTAEPKPRKVTSDCMYEKQMKLEFVEFA